jgi:NADP-dependent 3-hydroxy acid dehydrogenase YdfG
MRPKFQPDDQKYGKCWEDSAMKDQRKIVITGGARSLGAGIAHVLVERGHTVIIGDVNLASAQRTATRLGAACQAAHVDVADEGSLSGFIPDAAQRMGALDVLVNNAGIICTGSVTAMDDRALRRSVEVNMIGPINAVRAALPIMYQQGSGHVITVAGATAVKPLPAWPSTVAKAGIVAFSEALRREVRDRNVQVSTGLSTLSADAHYRFYYASVTFDVPGVQRTRGSVP